MLNHAQECMSGFEEVQSKVCKYFVNGGCWKGFNECIFIHPHSPQESEAPRCRNGNGCRYLANGVCSFFHEDIGVQNPRNQFPNHQSSQYQNLFQVQPRRWCRFLEDCNRVPYCPFVHAAEDFPELNQASNPPIWRQMGQKK